MACYNRYLRHFFRNARILVTTSWAADCFRRRGYETWVIPNMVEVGAFFGTLHQPGNGRVVVCRHLNSIYNIPMALHAFRAIKQEAKDSTLTIVGDGPMRDELLRLSQQLALEDVAFHPSVPHSHPPRIYATADVILNPTNAVGIPTSLVEAAAAGLVMISVDSGGIRELIQHGVNGFLVPPEDWRAMAKWAITALREPNLRNSICDAARRTALDYSWRKLRVRFYALYRAVMVEKSGTMK